MMKKLLSLAGLEINRMETDLSERFSTTWEDLGKRKKMKKDLEKNQVEKTTQHFQLWFVKMSE